VEAHVAQAVPSSPHAAWLSPFVHVVPEQHPPWQTVLFVAPQAVPQTDVVVLHACSSAQSAPAFAAVHPHCATPATTTHDVPAADDPHDASALHAVHPFACTVHVSTPVPSVPHCVAPSVHPFVQHEADPALPVHAPLVHDWVADSYQQLCASCAHVTTVVELSAQ